MKTKIRNKATGEEYTIEELIKKLQRELNLAIQVRDYWKEEYEKLRKINKEIPEFLRGFPKKKG